MIGKCVALSSSAQSDDIANSNVSSAMWPKDDPYAWVKTYVKPDELSFGCAPSTLSFAQPYQVASKATGLSWNICNKAYTIVMHGCNLDCPYCFCDKTTNDTVDVSPEQAVNDFKSASNVNTHIGIQIGVLRISGGEPLCQMEWVERTAYVSVLSSRRRWYTWLDTNLTIEPSSALLRVVGIVHSDIIGVNGCFKPGVNNVSLDKQLEIASAFIGSGAELFFYYPTWGGDANDLIKTLDALSAISEYAPLRVTIDEIKWGYSTQTNRNVHVSERDAKDAYTTLLHTYKEYVSKRYPPELLRLPSHQIPLVEL